MSWLIHPKPFGDIAIHDIFFSSVQISYKDLLCANKGIGSPAFKIPDSLAGYPYICLVQRGNHNPDG